MAAVQSDPGPVQFEAGFGFDGRYWLELFNNTMKALAGGGQSGATLIDSMYCVFTTVATAGDSAQLPPSKPGLTVAVTNATAKAMQVFANQSSTDTVNGIAGATGVSQMAFSQVFYTCQVSGAWTAQGLGAGYSTSGSNQTYSYQEAMTAKAGGGQQSSGASVITASISRYTTVANPGDSGTLPPAVPGLALTVINAGANIMALYPATATAGGVSGGDTINTNGQNGGFPVPVGTVVDLYCTIAGAWHTVTSSATNAAGGNVLAPTYAPSGMIARTFGPVTSGNTNTSQTLASYSVPGTTLQSTGQELEVTAWGVVANNAASKSIVLNIGGATVTTGSQTGAAYSWHLNGKYAKTGVNTQAYLFSGVASGGIVSDKAGTDTSVDTGTIAISCVATDASAASSDITLLGFTVEYFG